MKKISASILALVMMLVVVGCGNKDDIEQTNSDQYFDAEILGISEDTILVEPFGGDGATQWFASPEELLNLF